jgi:signal transduction histidine kinase
MKDLAGKAVIRDQNTTVMQQGRAWIESSWFKPGDNTPARKLSYVRKVQCGERVYIVGSGIYLPDER